MPDSKGDEIKEVINELDRMDNCTAPFMWVALLLSLMVGGLMVVYLGGKIWSDEETIARNYANSISLHSND